MIDTWDPWHMIGRVGIVVSSTKNGWRSPSRNHALGRVKVATSTIKNHQEPSRTIKNHQELLAKKKKTW